MSNRFSHGVPFLFLRFFKSSKVKLILDRARIFSCSTPKYTELQPAFMAAIKDSKDPAGDINSIDRFSDIVLNIPFKDDGKGNIKFDLILISYNPVS